MMTPVEINLLISELYGKERGGITKLANAVDLSRQFINQIATGKKHPSEETTAVLTSYLAGEYAAAIFKMSNKAGMKITHIELPVYPDGADMEKLIGKPWSAKIHRQIMAYTAEELNNVGINAKCVEE